MDAGTSGESWSLQESVGPTIGLCTDAPLYFRSGERVDYRFGDRTWRFAPGGHLWFNTYFNGLSVGDWKGSSQIDDLLVRVTFEGRLTARLHHTRHGAISRVIDEMELVSATRTTRSWTLQEWPLLEDGIVFVSLHALDPGVLAGFSFATRTVPRRAVRLGICITHYDRKTQVVPAIARLKRDLLDDPRYAQRVALVVVDNSRNLDASETTGATVVANRNLGGAGGFARGMMHLNDQGSFTHALFMDDDASCEVESIRRTIARLEHAIDPRTAVSGAMLRAAEPYRQFENGARFDGLCHPLGHGFDLRDPVALVHNERRHPSDYGAWWFFAFPLEQAIGYPFPYFVRGDDIDFSLRNDFRIVNANGIASWQDDFAVKHGPQTNYLDTRNHLLQILHGYRGGRALALYVSLRMFLPANLAGQYDLAAAAIMAIADVRRGPAFFAANADLTDPRRRIQALVRTERMKPMDEGTMRDARWTGLAEPRWRGALRWLTANGHLLPRWLFHRHAARFEKTYVLPLRGTFRRTSVYVYDAASGTGMRLDHSKRRFFGNLFAYLRHAIGLAIAYDPLARDYRAAYAGLTSDAFWREQFGRESADAGAVPTDAGTPAHRAAPGGLEQVHAR